MSYRERAEKDLKNKIVSRLNKLSDNGIRPWFNSIHYPKKIILDNSIQLYPLKKNKVILQYHSYEIFDFDKAGIEEYVETACKKLEHSMVELITERDLSKKIAYVEGDIVLSLDYRVSLLYLNYNIAEW